MKETVGRGLAICLLSLLSSSAYAALNDGLVSYWPFDGNLQDALGGNHGTLVGANTTASYTASQFGQGIDLDGVDQYVNAGNSPTLDMDVNGAGAKTGSVSISGWFRVDGFSKPWQALVAKGEGSAFRVARRDAGNIMSYAGGNADIPGAGVGPNVNNGAFHHVVAITEHQVSTRLWVDGMLVATNATPPTLVNNGNGAQPNPVNPPLWIGANPQAHTPNRTWNGPIDDLAIWNRPLTESEVMAIFSSGRSLGQLIPEPSTFMLLGAGLGSLFAIRRRR